MTAIIVSFTLAMMRPLRTSARGRTTSTVTPIRDESIIIGESLVELSRLIGSGELLVIALAVIVGELVVGIFASRAFVIVGFAIIDAGKVIIRVICIGMGRIVISPETFITPQTGRREGDNRHQGGEGNLGKSHIHLTPVHEGTNSKTLSNSLVVFCMAHSTGSVHSGL
ncbi:MAG: hypothetical protein ACKVT0_07840 [Planctomycetaceae bacterium]